MRRLPVVCVLAAASAFGTADQLVLARQAMARTVWVYQGGWFERRDPETWAEVNHGIYHNEGEILWEETTRNPSYIELFDADRRYRVRLRPNRVELRVGQGPWNVMYYGKWQE